MQEVMADILSHGNLLCFIYESLSLITNVLGFDLSFSM